MAAQASQVPNMEAFDAYFRRADLDKDGRISGLEAVAFFQGFNLPKQVLAQIWNHSDQNHTGYLGRQEFYNALRLVTVAQSGRELTPDLVRAALFGPAAAKIPAPQINPPSAPLAQINSLSTTTPSPQMNVAGPAQNPGIRGQQTRPSAAINQQFFAAGNHFMGPPQATPAAASLPLQGVGQRPPGAGSMVGPRLPSSNTPSLSTDWLGGRTTGASAGGTSQVNIRGANPLANQEGFGVSQRGPAPGISPRPQTSSAPAPASSVPPKSQDATSSSSSSVQPVAADSKALAVSGNGFSSDSAFGGDIFSSTPRSKPDTSLPTSATSVSRSSSFGTAVAGFQNSFKRGQLDSLQSTSSLPLDGSPLQQTQSLVKQNQLGAMQSTSALTISNVPVGAVGSASGQSQLPWPKISQADVLRYGEIFVQVDKDRDGRITGEQARNLFLSWKLPRDILKQVWDLSDQDNDGMLSLREFCTALYLMERYREGRPLPAVLPNSLRFDETLLLTTAQPSTPYGRPVLQPRPGLSPQVAAESRPAVPTTSVKQTVQTPTPSQSDGTVQPAEQKSRVPVLEKHLVDQLSGEEQSSLTSKFQEATDAEKKVQGLEKEILDSKEKIDFYHAKMQELILYKSRCDNRLNEITERASADKNEFESLAKKYEGKCKQVGDVASKLTIEEATFRDIQERKLALYNVIIKMEQGGSTDGVLQVRAEQIQSDLEQLVKALNEQCKRFGLRAKPMSLVELPFGWQGGIQEGAADWDEDWDKFEDDGFTIIKELTVEVENVAAAKPMPPTSQNDKTSKDEVPAVASSSDVENKIEKTPTATERMTESESTYARSEDGSAKSSPGSPGRNAFDSLSEENHLTQSGVHDISPHARESNSNHGLAESSVSGDKFVDEHLWSPTFDRGDDTDSIWNFGSKESDNDRYRQNFGSEEFGLYPVRIDSPSAASVFGKDKKNPIFDSAPSTPLFSSSFSPRFNEGPDDNSFDSFAHFDSFRMQESGITQNQSFARSDSIHSTDYHDSGFPQTLARFDSIRSTMTDHSQHQTFARFDSIRNTTDYSQGFSFDDADPFGSGPFKSSGSRSPRTGTDNWSAF